jgi:hypothetical protein
MIDDTMIPEHLDDEEREYELQHRQLGALLDSAVGDCDCACVAWLRDGTKLEFGRAKYKTGSPWITLWPSNDSELGYDFCNDRLEGYAGPLQVRLDEIVFVGDWSMNRNKEKKQALSAESEQGPRQKLVTGLRRTTTPPGESVAPVPGADACKNETPF